jgi:hypothetical protein
MHGLDRFIHKLSQNRLPMDDSVGSLVHTLIIRAAHAHALITRRRREHQALRNFSTEKGKKQGIPPRKRPLKTKNEDDDDDEGTREWIMHVVN